jgi:hypothetical protein
MKVRMKCAQMLVTLTVTDMKLCNCHLFQEQVHLSEPWKHVQVEKHLKLVNRALIYVKPS